MAAGLEAALEAGLLPPPSPELAKALEAAGATPGSKIDPAALGLDAATLDRLAKALSETAGQKLSSLAKSGLIDPQRLAALEKLLAADPKANPFKKGLRPRPKCHGKRPEGCGT